MRNERPLKETERQNWDKIASRTQININDTLADVGLEIEKANFVLSQLYKEDPELASKRSAEIVAYLDNLWEYMNHCFFVTGQWHAPMVEDGMEGIIIKQVKKEAFATVQSNGFIVRPIEMENGEEVLRVGLSFITGRIPLATPNLQGVIQPLAFAEPHEITMQYLRPSGNGVVSSSLEDVGDAINRANAIFQLYTNHHGSTFYKQSQKKQQEFMRSVLDIIDITMPSPESMDQLLIEDTTVRKIYIKKQGDRELTVIEPPKKDMPFVISGRVIGFTVADLICNSEYKRYDSAAELEAAEAGLSMIVQPSQVNFTLDGYNSEVFYLPLSSMDEVVLSLR